MIRFAEISDLEYINDIYNQAVDSRNSTADLDYISLDERKIWFENHNPHSYPVFVYEKDKKIVGWLSISPYRRGRRALADTAEMSYYIHNDYQRQGIGSELVKFCLENIRLFGIKHLICILLGTNIGSIRLLEKFNFEKWGELPNIVNIDGRICSHLYYGKSLPSEEI